MDLYFLLSKYVDALKKIEMDKVYEIRLRVGCPIKIKYNNEFYYLSQNGLSKLKENALYCQKSDIDDVIMRATEHSIYAFNERIKEGYITYSGIRIGLAGECVFDGDKIITIKNYTSLNIRIPHDVIGCSNDIIKYVFDDDFLKNTLIVSPASFGKTTLLKDLACFLSKQNVGSILIIDERGEFNNVKGENIDLISYSNKLYAFNYGLRSMSPDVVITDELVSVSDWEFVKKAVKSGVKVLASCHGTSIEDVYAKSDFIKNIFERYVILKSYGAPGKIQNVYDADLKIL